MSKRIQKIKPGGSVAWPTLHLEKKFNVDLEQRILQLNLDYKIKDQVSVYVRRDYLPTQQARFPRPSPLGMAA